MDMIRRRVSEGDRAGRKRLAWTRRGTLWQTRKLGAAAATASRKGPSEVAPSVTNLHTHGRGAKATRVAKNRTVGRGEYDGALSISLDRTPKGPRREDGQATHTSRNGEGGKRKKREGRERRWWWWEEK